MVGAGGRVSAPSKLLTALAVLLGLLGALGQQAPPTPVQCKGPGCSGDEAALLQRRPGRASDHPRLPADSPYH